MPDPTAHAAPVPDEVADRLRTALRSAFNARGGFVFVPAAEVIDIAIDTVLADPAVSVAPMDEANRAGYSPREIADCAIGLFLEFRDQHCHDEDAARAFAVAEVVEGCAAEIGPDPPAAAPSGEGGR